MFSDNIHLEKLNTLTIKKLQIQSNIANYTQFIKNNPILNEQQILAKINTAKQTITHIRGRPSRGLNSQEIFEIENRERNNCKQINETHQRYSKCLETLPNELQLIELEIIDTKKKISDIESNFINISYLDLDKHISNCIEATNCEITQHRIWLQNIINQYPKEYFGIIHSLQNTINKYIKEYNSEDCSEKLSKFAYVDTGINPGNSQYFKGFENDDPFEEEETDMGGVGLFD
jgi:hypothetical protein